MTDYTIDLNGKRYSLTQDFLNALQTRAQHEYSENRRFSSWWDVASEENYDTDVWRDSIHEEGDPVLTIETTGVMVPWERLDQLEARMPGEDMKRNEAEIFGRTHFSLTPHRFEEVPEPGGDDPNKIPTKPEEVDGAEMVFWLPNHPEVKHTWGAGEALAPMTSWVEWNVQQRANQPQPDKDKNNTHDRFESLCRIHDCEVVAEYTPSNSVPEGPSGSVKRKGESSFTDGRYGGSNWNR